jgi:hypothetical protein
MKDPDTPSTVWASAGSEVLRTDGTYSFSRSVEDFSELIPNVSSLTTVAPDRNNIAWVGSDQGLIKLNAGTGSYQFFSPANSNLPGDWVLPFIVSPDGKVWFQFSNSITSASGLAWFDGINCGVFNPSVGGLPNDQITDMEIKIIPNGYELWISCLSRGVAVLKVKNPVLTLSVGLQAINAQDTITVELRNSASPYNLIQSMKSIGGQGIAKQIQFSQAVDGTPYYLVVKHRNSIETWSSHTTSFASGELSYNFTTSLSQAYGNNMIQINTNPNVYAIYSGDVDQDGSVDAFDLSEIDNDAFNFVSGYVPADLNGDLFVDANDFAVADNNAANFVGTIRP